MIQELLARERKISITNEGFLQASSHSTCTTPTTGTTNTNVTTTPPSNPTDSGHQNLRCPRCDSTNTKFCYYNNYNLTQPRHFCKTCRRYWTKGGALRNVPIGGGCRKNKISTPPPKSSSAYAKLKTSFTSLSSDITGKQSFHLGNGSDHDLWSSSQNSQILALLRAPQNPNPTPLSNGAQFSLPCYNNNTTQAPSVGVSNSLWRNNQQQQNGFVTTGGDANQNSGIQELFQRLKSSRSGYYYGNHQPVSLSSNVMTSSSSFNNSALSSVLESAPGSGGEFSYLNPPFSWADVATQSAGAYP